MNDSPFEEFDNDLNTIDPKELIYSIWLKPKLTLRYILERCPTKHVFTLLVLGGIARAIARASDKGLGDTMSVPLVLLISILSGGVLGWIFYYIYAWALSASGSWLNGEASSEKFRTVIAWSLVPSIASLTLLIPELILLGDDLFRSEPINDSTFSIVCWIVFGLLELGLGIWSVVILVIGIKLIQGFGTLKAIFNMIIPMLILIIPLLIVALLAS